MARAFGWKRHMRPLARGTPAWRPRTSWEQEAAAESLEAAEAEAAGEEREEELERQVEEEQERQQQEELERQQEEELEVLKVVVARKAAEALAAMVAAAVEAAQRWLKRRCVATTLKLG